MSHPTLLQLLSQSSALPSIPRVVSLVLKELDAQDPDPRRVSALLSMDPMLVGRMIKLANSAFFATSREVGSVEAALSILGIAKARTIVTAVALGNTFRSVPGIDLDSFWRYSLNSAKLAKPLAASLGLNDSTAFTSALLHAIGELVLYTATPRAGHALAGHNVFALDRVEVQRSLLGYSFVEVSGAFAREWEFPENIVYALERQDEPGEDDFFDPLAATVFMASWRARTIELRMDPEAMQAAFPEHVADALGLDMEKVLHNDPGAWASTSEVAIFLD